MESNMGNMPQIDNIELQLQETGLKEEQISQIKADGFKEYLSEEEFNVENNNSVNYQKILQALSDGYSMDELSSHGIKHETISIFNKDLKDNNLTVENVKAINQYSNGSNMILGIKNNRVSKEEIEKNIYGELSSKLEQRQVDEMDIQKVSEQISDLDYTKPLYENYDFMKKFLEESNILKVNNSSILSSIKDINSLKNINSTIGELDDVLAKSRLPEPIKVYRAMKGELASDVDNIQNKVIQVNGITSTSPVYDSSFAKYEKYKNVLEMYLPKGTQGLDITRFSDYDNAENEILLNSFEYIVTEYNQGIEDKNGNVKNVMKGIAISKEKSCYELENNKLPSENNEKVNVFNRFKERLRNLFKKPDNTQLTYNQKSKSGNKSSEFRNSLKDEYETQKNYNISEEINNESNNMDMADFER